MKIKKSQKGFTLLEICLSFALFAIMMESLMLFTAQVVRQCSEFVKLEALEQEAVTVQDFIKNYIRTADKIKIESMQEDESKSTEGGSLKSIEGTFNIPNQSKPNGIEVKKSKIVLHEIRADEEGKGQYELTYEVIGDYGWSISNNLISEMIDGLTVYCEGDIAVFKCCIKAREEKNEKLQVNKSFVEITKYKE